MSSSRPSSFSRKFWLIALVLLFLALDVFIFLKISNWTPPNSTPQATIHVQDDPGAKPATIKREKAVEFALEQTAALIKYLFGAAAAFLVLLAKILIDTPQSESAALRTKISGSSLFMLMAATLSLLSSLWGGLQAQNWFANLATDAEFSFVNEFGYWCLCQQVFLLIGGILTIFSVIPLIVKRSDA